MNLTLFSGTLVEKKSFTRSLGGDISLTLAEGECCILKWNDHKYSLPISLLVFHLSFTPISISFSPLMYTILTTQTYNPKAFCDNRWKHLLQQISFSTYLIVLTIRIEIVTNRRRAFSLNRSPYIVSFSSTVSLYLPFLHLSVVYYSIEGTWPPLATPPVQGQNKIRRDRVTHEYVQDTVNEKLNLIICLIKNIQRQKLRPDGRLFRGVTYVQRHVGGRNGW